MAGKQAPGGAFTVRYMGADYEVDREALMSMRCQRALANADRDQAASFDAMDAILCGKLDEYVMAIPEADGEVAPHGASMAAMAAFFNAVYEQVTGVKN